VTPPAIKPLGAVRPEAVAAWQAEKRAAAVAREAASLAQSVSPGTRLVTAANAKGLKVETSPPLRRSGSTGTPVPLALVAKLFAAAPGAVVTSADATGSYVAQLVAIRPPDQGTTAKAATAELSQVLTADLEFDLAAEFTQGLRRQFPVDIHHEIIDRMF
jgi:peptidyl-prolyl cis-trans isomerase D